VQEQINAEEWERERLSDAGEAVGEEPVVQKNTKSRAMEEKPTHKKDEL
jgi:hypothetical protein